MDERTQQLWNDFIKSGRIADYLKYAARIDRKDK